MNRFMTLIRREWLQHRIGWIVLMTLPTVLLLAGGLFGQVHVDLGDRDLAEMPGALPIAIAVVVGGAVMTMGLAWTASMIQSPGLARRDVQDRSIEFWLSLPVSHTQSLSATLLTHLLLVPWAGLLIGAAGGMLVSVIVVGRVAGIGEWFGLPWGALATAALFLVLRVSIGLALATLWLSPLTLLTMAASAWLKRWGVPLVAGTLAIGGLVLDKVYGTRIVWDALRVLGDGASRAFLGADRDGTMALRLRSPDDVADVLGTMPGWMLHDLGHALAALASPAFVAALAGGAAGFALLWLRRARGA